MEGTAELPADGVLPLAASLIEALAVCDSEGLPAAEAMLRAKADEAASVAGESSAAHCRALADLAQLYLARGAEARAVEVMRSVCGRSLPDDDDAKRERTVAWKLLGEMLAKVGDLAGAEEAMRASIELRRAVFGEGSVGLAFGLEALAAICLAAGKKKRALRLCNEAIAHCEAHRDVHVVPLWLLRAEVLAAMGREQLLPDANTIDDQLFEFLVQQAIDSTHIREAGLSPAVIQAVLDLVDVRAPDHPASGILLRTKARAAGRAGEKDVRTRALHDLTRLVERHGNASGAFVLRLDTAASAADHDPQAAREGFQRAVADAAALGPEARYLAHQAHGAFLAARRQRKSAAAELRTALAAALETQDRHTIAGARLALATFLADGGREEEARAELELAAVDLPPAERRDRCVRITTPAGIDARVRADHCGTLRGMITRFIGDSLQRDMPGATSLGEVVLGGDGWLEARCDGPLGPAERAAVERALTYRAAEQEQRLAASAAHAPDAPPSAPLPPLPSGVAPSWDPRRFRGAWPP